jgi:hypothetical protein
VSKKTLAADASARGSDEHQSRKSHAARCGESIRPPEQLTQYLIMRISFFLLFSFFVTGVVAQKSKKDFIKI